MRLYSFVAVLMVAVMGYSFRPSGAPDGPGTSAPPGARANNPLPPPPNTGLTRCALEEYFDARHGSGLAWALPRVGGPSSADFIIATIPDPVHTRQGLTTDRLLEAIEQAAAAAGYYFDRAVLPWATPAAGAQPPVAVDDRCQNSQNDPGLLIFHRSDHKPPTDLFILLVGETPTSGLLKEQFNRALDIIADPYGRHRRCLKLASKERTELNQHVSVSSSDVDLQVNLHTAPQNAYTQCEKPSQPTAVKILGPTYSGSYYSLETLLDKRFRDLKGKWPALRVRSGTTLSHELIQQFRDWMNSRSQQDFVTFNEDDENQIQSFVHLLATRGFAGADIAILREDETGFGGGRLDVSDALQISYPRGITRLRSAYEQDKDLSSQSENDRVPRSILRLDMDSTGSDEDSVPEYSPRQTTVSQEAELFGTMTSLNLHKPAFVIVTGSDPIDMLFVTKFVRKNYNRGGVVTLGADQLLSRDHNDASLRGVLSLSNYPILPVWMDEPDLAVLHQHRVFADSASVGMFNATVELIQQELSQDNPKFKAPPELPPAPYFEYAEPRFRLPTGQDVQGQRRPAVWLTAIGDDGYWPIAAIPTAASSVLVPCTSCPPAKAVEDRTGPNDPGLKGRVHDFSFSTINKIGIVLSIAAYLVLLVFLASGQLRETLALHQQFCAIRDQRRNALIASMGLALTSCLILLAPYFYGQVRDLTAGWHWVAIGSAAICSILLFIALWGREEYQVAIAYGVFTLFLAGWYGLRFQDARLLRDSEFNLISYYRQSWILSGISPNLPLLLLCGAALWAAWYLLRVRATFDLRRPFLPPTATPHLPSESVWYKQQHWRTITTSKKFGFVATVLLACFVAVGTVGYSSPNSRFFTLVPASSIEGYQYDGFYLILFTGCALLMINAVWNAWETWRSTRRLLDALDRSPLRRAFDDRIHEFSWKPLWGFGMDTHSTYRPVNRAAESLDHLCRQLQQTNPTAMNYIAHRHGLITDGWSRIQKQISSIDFLPPQIQNIGWRTRVQFRVRSAIGLPQVCLLAAHNLVLQRWQRVQRNLAIMCILVWQAVLEPAWATDTRLSANRQSTTKKDSGTALAAQKVLPPALRDVDSQEVHLAEEFVALIYINFVYRIIMRIRWLVLAATGIYVLLLLSATSYPFEPQASIRAFFVALFLVMGALIVTIYAQMHRDPVLSYLTDTDPGKLGGDFWLQILSLGAVPVFTILATAVPGLGRFFFTWLQPALGALHTK